MTTIPAGDANFLTGAVLSWAIPIAIVLVTWLVGGRRLPFGRSGAPPGRTSRWRASRVTGSRLHSGSARRGGSRTRARRAASSGRRRSPPRRRRRGRRRASRSSRPQRAGRRRRSAGAPRAGRRGRRGGAGAALCARGVSRRTTSLSARCAGRVTLSRSSTPAVLRAARSSGRRSATPSRCSPAPARPAVVVVSIDPAADSADQRPRRASPLACPVRLAVAHGAPTPARAVWRAYGIERERRAPRWPPASALYLVDARGDERAGYLPPVLPNFLALDIRRVEADAARPDAAGSG